MTEGRHYNRTQLEPHLSVAVLYEDATPVSFDINYFSQLITFTHGSVQNFGERDGWYGTTTLTCDHPISPFMMGYIRHRLEGLSEDERRFIEHALDGYEHSHPERYASEG